MKGKNVAIYVIVCLLAIAILALGFLKFYPKNQRTNKLTNSQTTPTTPEISNQIPQQTTPNNQNDTQTNLNLKKVFQYGENSLMIDAKVEKYEGGGQSVTFSTFINNEKIIKDKYVKDVIIKKTSNPSIVLIESTDDSGMLTDLRFYTYINLESKQVITIEEDNSRGGYTGAFYYITLPNKTELSLSSLIDEKNCQGNPKENPDKIIFKEYTPIFKNLKINDTPINAFDKELAITCRRCVAECDGSLVGGGLYSKLTGVTDDFNKLNISYTGNYYKTPTSDKSTWTQDFTINLTNRTETAGRVGEFLTTKGTIVKY